MSNALRVPTKRLKAKVAETLALRILRKDYQAGAPIPHETDLLKEFGVSRTCLREALQMLSAKGLVYSRPRVGTVVNNPLHWNFLDADMLRWRQQTVSREVFLRELFAVRRMIEPETAALAAQNIGPEMLADLQEAVIGMARGNGERTEETVQADVAFHRLLLAASGNPLLSGLGATIEEALRASIAVTSHPEVGSRFALDKHIAVFEAVRHGNAAAARKAMTALLDITEEVLDRTSFSEPQTAAAEGS